MRSFVKLMRGEVTRELLRDLKAFGLLTLAAIRARWSEGPSIHGLKPGQAFIGDYRECGLKTEKEYRMAKKRLEKAGYASFKGTNKGTIVTILTTDVFDVFGHGSRPSKTRPGADKRRSRGGPRATNEDGRRKDKKDKPEEQNRVRLIDIEDYSDIHNPENDAVSVALSVTGEGGNKQAEGYLRKALDRLGDQPFRSAVAELWGEMKSDTINKPGAILVKKLKKLM